MSKTSTTLRACATVGVAALTFGSIAVGASSAYAATTPAAGSIAITPPTTGTTGNTGQCLVYTATPSPAATGGTLDVTLTSSTATGATEGFCTTGGAQTGTVVAGTANSTTDSFAITSGAITFGVTDLAAETVGIQVFNDVAGTGVFAGGDANITSSATFKSNTGDASVKSLSATPSTATARPGDTVTYTVTALNGNTAVPVADQGVSGATINYVVTGPDAQGPSVCSGGGTAANGTTTCNITLSGTAKAAGADSIIFFDNNAVNSGPGVDPGDTQTTASLTDLGLSPLGDTLNTYCYNGAVTADTNKNCTAALTNTQISGISTPNAIAPEFLAEIVDPADTATGSASSNDPGHAVPVTFALSGASAAATLSSTTGTCTPLPGTKGGLTPEYGVCDTSAVTVNEPNPTLGEQIVVTATITGGTATQSSAATVTVGLGAAAARNITLTPAQTGTVGKTSLVTATVTDVNGKPVPGVALTFTSTGQGAFVSNCYLSTTCTIEGGGASLNPPVTDANGQFQVQVASGTAGVQTISATINAANDSQCADQAGFVNGVPTTGVTAGTCSATTTVTYAASGSTTPPKKTIEKPTLVITKSGKAGHIELHAATHIAKSGQQVHFYLIKSGTPRLEKSGTTGHLGRVGVSDVLKKGTYRFEVRVVHPAAGITSEYSSAVSVTIKS